MYGGERSSLESSPNSLAQQSDLWQHRGLSDVETNEVDNNIAKKPVKPIDVTQVPKQQTSSQVKM